LALAVIYVPYLLLFFVAEQKTDLLKIWPIFPGLALVQLIKPFAFLDSLTGIGGVLTLTLLFVGCSMFAIIRFRHALWLLCTLLAGLAFASGSLVWIILLLLRA